MTKAESPPKKIIIIITYDPIAITGGYYHIYFIKILYYIIILYYIHYILE